ncbi:MAG: hypothetical protein HOP18_15135 [Deltaproteobacteria bacterium]|nr:hypothetical protein [Deltaproteobacteria bacterium]
MKGQRKQHRWAGALVVLWLSVGSAPAWAATITVISTADSGGTCPGATCTLRQAIADAASGDTIDFNVSLPTITLASQLTLNKNLTITGPGANQLAISGGGTVRVMAVTADVTVNISGLTIRNGSGDFGGGISNAGTVTVSNSTFSGNSATFEGGGIFNGPAGTVAVSNSTFSGNSADSDGGGIFNSFGTVTVSNSTFSGNSASDLGGGIYNVGPATVNVRGTIIANSPSGDNCRGTGLTSQGDNISSDGSCVATSIPLNDRNNTDPLLNALANNGGPTQTFALQNTSPAVNTVTVNTCPLPAMDQRWGGFNRPAGAACDIGAFELGATPVELQEFVVE